MQYSVQGLKDVIEFILENLGSLDENNQTLNGKVADAKKVTDSHTKEIDRLKMVTKDLEAKTVHLEDTMSEMQCQIESNALNSNMNKANIEAITENH